MKVAGDDVTDTAGNAATADASEQSRKATVDRLSTAAKTRASEVGTAQKVGLVQVDPGSTPCRLRVPVMRLISAL